MYFWKVCSTCMDIISVLTLSIWCHKDRVQIVLKCCKSGSLPQESNSFCHIQRLSELLSQYPKRRYKNIRKAIQTEIRTEFIFQSWREHCGWGRAVSSGGFERTQWRIVPMTYLHLDKGLCERASDSNLCSRLLQE